MTRSSEQAIKALRELLDVIEALDSSPMQRDNVPPAVRNAAKRARAALNDAHPQERRT